ncbi:MAG: hypothetical protein ACRCTQ_01065 [Brevinemataceae bacterium]
MKNLKLILLFILFPISIFSTETKFITDNEFNNIWLWQLSNTSMTAGQGITLSQDAENLYKTSYLLWAAKKIKNVQYLGTADSAKIIKLSQNFQEEIIYTDPDRSLVGAIESDAQGIIAAVSPDSEIIHLNSNNEVSQRTAVSNTYIWDIVPNPKGGFFILTGLSAQVYEYNNKQLSEPISIDSEDHLLQGLYIDNTLWVLGENALYKKEGSKFTAVAGFNFTASGFVYTNNTFYIAQSSISKNTDSSKKDQIFSSLISVKKNGVIEELFSLQGFYFTAIGAHNNKLVIGADQFGLYVVYDPIAKKFTYSSLGTGKILEVLSENGELTLITSDSSGIWKIGNNTAQQGCFISEVYDTKNVSSWGAFSSETSTPVDTKIEFFIQSGVTDNPEYWSDWTPIADGQKIPVSNARFIRYKAVLYSAKKALPYVYKVKFPYTEINLAPVISQVNILQEGQTIKAFWEAIDPNNDKLEFDVYLADDGMPKVKLNPYPITTTNWNFPYNYFPSGNKRITITASDRPSNSDQTALTAEYNSIPILFDTDYPIISDFTVKQSKNSAEISVKVTDPTSIISKFIYIVNGNQEVYVLPEDGFFDSKEETFRFNVPIPNTTFIQVQVVDFANNISSKGITVLKK